MTSQEKPKAVLAEHLEALIHKWDARLKKQMDEFEAASPGNQKDIVRLRMSETMRCINELQGLVKEAV